MAQVRITNEDGVHRATIPLVDLAKEQQLRLTTLARITVSRDDLNSITGLTPGRDRVFIEENGTDTFGGILRTPSRKGGRPTLRAHSFAQYMRQAKPVPPGQEKVGVDDSVLVQETIDSTPQLSAGTLETVTPSETYIFSGVSQLTKARTVEEVAGGELVFRPDLTVDYVDQRGSDKTGTTLSPANGSFIEDTFVVDRNGASGNTSHLKLYGVGQGTAQIEATVVPADDGGSYTNKVTYTNSDWSAGDDKIWDTRTNKDLKRVSPLQSWGLTLIEDLQKEEVRVDTVVKDAEVELGDRFHVLHPEEGVDEDLRAVEVVELISAEGGTRYETVFSNYSAGQVNPSIEDYKDVARYNQAFEGDLVQLEKGPGRGPVGPNHDYVFKVYYPEDVVAEVRADLNLSALPYRAFSSGAASGGGAHTHDTTVSTTSGQKDYSANYDSAERQLADATGTSTPTTTTFTGIATSNDVWVTVTGTVGSGTDPIAVFIRLYDGSGTSTQVDDVGMDRTSGETFSGTVAVGENNRSSSDVTVEVEAIDSNVTNVSIENTEASLIGVPQHDHLVVSTETSTEETPAHTHQPEPGLLDWDGSDQSPAHYPENVDVVVNGTSQGYALGGGTGEFEETVDLAGVLSSGWNTIALTSDGLGHLDASFSADLFRQSL